jgi:hypothetical protein
MLEEFFQHPRRIFTADPAAPYAEALAIRGDRIAAVGTDDAAERTGTAPPAASWWADGRSDRNLLTASRFGSTGDAWVW